LHFKVNSFHHQYKGIINYGLNRYDVSLQAFGCAIELLPMFSTNYIWRAAVYFDLRAFDKCLEDLDSAARLDAGEGPLFWRGLLYLRLGEYKKAMYDLKSSLYENKRANSSPEALPPSRTLFWLGIALDRLGEADDAKLMLSRVADSAKLENKSTKFTEPARLAILNGDINLAKQLYRSIFAGPYAVDVAKTEEAQLLLLTELYPERQDAKAIKTWFSTKRKHAYSIKSGKFYRDERATSLTSSHVRSNSL